MPSTFADIVEQARRLTAEERACLADAMLQSLRDTPLAEVEAAWDREIEQRVAALDRGESETSAVEDVLAEAQRRLR